ncbi:MAG: ribose 5-phosphate isomerase B [Oscillospiraceae bacterium]|nr:ribose 5-phosphate isomerase B [Oscillospiraceae bacterium]
MKIALGCDHGGFELMQLVKAHLKERNIEFEDFGTYSAASCHYPEFGFKAAKAVADGLCDRGIVICTTGIGISITANKVRGIRCALCSDPWSAEMTRRHNDANMLALGASVIGRGVALKIVDTFLATAFEGGRHQTRVDMIHECERNG